MKVLKDVELTVVVKDMELLLQIVRRNVNVLGGGVDDVGCG